MKNQPLSRAQARRQRRYADKMRARFSKENLWSELQGLINRECGVFLDRKLVIGFLRGAGILERAGEKNVPRPRWHNRWNAESEEIDVSRVQLFHQIGFMFWELTPFGAFAIPGVFDHVLVLHYIGLDRPSWRPRESKLEKLGIMYRSEVERWLEVQRLLWIHYQKPCSAHRHEPNWRSSSGQRLILAHRDRLG